MNITKSRMAAVAAGAVVLVTLAGVGGATAGALITSADIKDGTIAKVDLHGSAVTSGKIKDGGVKSVDIADGTISAADIATGVIPTAAPAPAGGLTWVSGTKAMSAGPSGTGTATADLLCPAGKHVIGAVSSTTPIHAVVATAGTSNVDEASVTAVLWKLDDGGTNVIGLDSVSLAVANGPASPAASTVTYAIPCA